MRIRTFLTRLGLATVAVVFTATSVALGLSPEQKRVLQSGSQYFNVEETLFCGQAQANPTSGGLAAGSSIYMLGDSITNGASAKYRAALTAKGITPYINAVGGRAWTLPGSGASGAFTAEAGGPQKGSDAVQADATQIASAKGIVIALGSNGALNANPIVEIVAAVRSKNPTAPIWWVNVVASDTNTYPNATAYGPFNEALQTQAVSLGYSIIDWHGAVIPSGNPADVPTSTVLDPNNYLSTDGLHPTPTGQDALVALVVSSLGAAPTSNVVGSGCSCSAAAPGTAPGTKEENFQNTWNYLVTVKGLSEEAAAGLMGNLDAESGIDPHNVQNDAVDSAGNPVPDGPEIPFDLIKGKYGYGIAQWTSIGRQQGLIDFAAKPPPRSTGDLGLQLDYLWEELTLSYTGVLAVLQQPGVTVEEASDEVLLRFEIPEAVLPPPRSTPERKQAALVARRARGLAIFNTYSGKPAGTFNSSSCLPTSTTVNVDDPDTTDVPCAPGTTDGGVVSAYNDGVEFKIRVCTAGGIKVNSQISGSIKLMLDAATAAGVALSGGGFRTLQDQVGIYNSHCDAANLTPTPPPYPKASAGDYTKCPGAAPPGYSNHEMGFAIDFSCAGTLIPQSYTAASSNACFTWLLANGGTYGLFEFGRGASREKVGYEAWHWSVDGS